MGRIATRTITNGSVTYQTSYAYLAGDTTAYGAGATTPLVTTITQSGYVYAYTYDDVGNITSARLNSAAAITYAYDAVGQLIRVNDASDPKVSGGTTWVMNYDCGGNILSKARYAYTTGTPGSVSGTDSYTYDTTWCDKLTVFNQRSLTSDAIGNTESFGNYKYVWLAGRQLSELRFTTDNTVYVSFLYDPSGLRVAKTCNGGTTYYAYSGERLTHLERFGNVLHFFYDAQNRPAMCKFGNAYYTYVHNLQGDVVALLDSGNAAVVTYQYDSWGRQIARSGSLKDTLGYLNPFRYRGYVYDEETELYYLKSRYYNPVLSRFISADTELGKIGGVLAHNVFAYCRDNPIIHNDPNGKYPQGGLVSQFASAIKAIIYGASALLGAMQASIAGAKLVNSVAKRAILDRNDVIRSIVFPVPRNTMREISANLGVLARDQRVVFSYKRDANAFIVYSIDKYGSLFENEYSYETYRLKEDYELRPWIDAFFIFADDPASSAFFPNWYSYMGYMWSVLKDMDYGPMLSSNVTTITQSKSDPYLAHMYLYT